MMNKKFEMLNFVGSICSIAALIITMSQNYTILNIIKIIFGVIAFVSTMGLVYGIANFCYSIYVKIDYWAVKTLYWLFVLLVGLALSAVVGFFVSSLVEFLLMMLKSMFALYL